jgi:hypothetical protein
MMPTFTPQPKPKTRKLRKLTPTMATKARSNALWQLKAAEEIRRVRKRWSVIR